MRGHSNSVTWWVCASKQRCDASTPLLTAWWAPCATNEPQILYMCTLTVNRAAASDPFSHTWMDQVLPGFWILLSVQRSGDSLRCCTILHSQDRQYQLLTTLLADIKLFVSLFFSAVFEGDHMVRVPLLQHRPGSEFTEPAGFGTISGRTFDMKRAKPPKKKPKKWRRRWRCVQVISVLWSRTLATGWHGFRGKQRERDREEEEEKERNVLNQLCMPGQGHITHDGGRHTPAHAWCQAMPLPWKQYKQKYTIGHGQGKVQEDTPE